jgi:hypothetical protein
MPAPRLILPLSRLLPPIFPGAYLHRLALVALARGEHDAAGGLLERAALRYRAEGRVEPLARLRVHELILGIRSGREPDADGRLALEVERRLCRLERIESLSEPFELTDSRRLLGVWMEELAGPAATRAA